jgi:HEAT repeat protein
MAFTALAEDAAPVPPPPTEDELIAVLQGDTSFEQKEAACRALRQIGTDKSVPALAALLASPVNSHIARYALEPMQSPAAGAALRDALAGLEGPARVGVVISIGARRDAAALPLLTPLLDVDDTATVRAAAGAIGRIGSVEAADALQRAAATASDAVRVEVAEGLLAAAGHLTKEGKGAEAVAYYEPLMLDTWPAQIRAGAFAGIAYADRAVLPGRMLAALGGNDPVFRDMAAQIVAETDGTVETDQYVAALPTLPAAGQTALLRGLATRADAAARPGAVALLGSEDPAVQVAALVAMGTLGSAADVATLAKFLASDDETVLRATQASLRGMSDPAVDQALVDLLKGVDPAVRAQLLDLLTDRMSALALPAAVANLPDADERVRLAALRGLVELATLEEGAITLAALKTAASESERNLAAKALGNIAKQAQDEALPLVLAAMANANEETLRVLIRTLDRIGTPQALSTVVSLVKGKDAISREEAARVLSAWRSAEAAPHLLQLAHSDDATLHDLGLRGYVRLAREEAAPETKAVMLNQATELARETSERWLVLAAWATLKSSAALDALLPNLDDPAVRNEAAAAIITVATDLAKREETKAAAKDALNAILAKCDDRGIRDRTEAALKTAG